MDDFCLSPEELKEAKKTGLSPGEIGEALHLFRIRAANSRSGGKDARFLAIEDVDILLRQLRLFMPMRFLWALFQEIDKNRNGKIEITEFFPMVAMLRGKGSFSQNFYLESIPRATKARYIKVFEIVSGEDKCMDRDELNIATRQLNLTDGHINTDSDEYKKSMAEVGGPGKTRFYQNDFLVLQAKMRKPPPLMDVAMLNLTDEEHERLSEVYSKWRQASSSLTTSPQELRPLLGQLGYPMSLQQVTRLMLTADLDGTRLITKQEFLFLLVTLGAGSSDCPRTLLRPGDTYEDAFTLGVTLEDLWELGYEDLVEIRKAGWSAQAIMKADLAEAWQLRQLGFDARELRKIGMAPKQLKLAGFSMEQLRNAGFSCASLRECVSALSKNRAVRPNEESAIGLRPNEHTPAGPSPMGPLFDVGGPHGEKRWWATPRIKNMLDGPPSFGTQGARGHKTRQVRARPMTC